MISQSIVLFSTIWVGHFSTRINPLHGSFLHAPQQEDNRNQKISAAQEYMSTLTAYLENHPKASFEVAYKKAMAYLKKLNIASFVVPVISTELSSKKRIVNVFINESKTEFVHIYIADKDRKDCKKNYFKP